MADLRAYHRKNEVGTLYVGYAEITGDEVKLSEAYVCDISSGKSEYKGTVTLKLKDCDELTDEGLVMLFYKDAKNHKGKRKIDIFK